MKSTLVILCLIFVSSGVFAQEYSGDAPSTGLVTTRISTANETCHFNQDVIVSFKQDLEDIGDDLTQRVLVLKDKEYRAKGINTYSQTKITSVMGVDLKNTSTIKGVILQSEAGDEAVVSAYYLTMGSHIKIKLAVCN